MLPMTNAWRRRKPSIRLRGYDYARSGTYFVTICTQDRACIFGAVEASEVKLNSVGAMVSEVWSDLPRRFAVITLDAWVLMPNHFHALVVLGRDEAPAPDDRTTAVRVSLGEVIGAFKSITTHRYIQGVHAGRWPPFRRRLWHRNYYERIIRSADALERVRRYIALNPARWTQSRAPS